MLAPQTFQPSFSPAPKRHPAPLHALLRFGHTQPETPSAPKNQKPGWLKSGLNMALALSPLANLTGGACLLAGGSMTYLAPTVEATATKGQELDPELQNTLKQWEDLKKGLIQTGWTITSVSAMAGMFNAFTMGVVFKQPSMVLSALASASLCPFLILDPSISIRTGMILLGAPWLAGLANRFRNDRMAATGDTTTPPLAWDMAPLWNAQALQAWAKSTPPHSPSKKPPSTPVLWGTYALKTLHFVAHDQLRLFTKIGELFRKNGTKQPENAPKQSWSTNSEAHSRVGAVLYMVGAVPMLMLGGESHAVNEVCSKLIGLGGFLGDTALFFRAVREKDGKLLIGIPLRNLGGAWFHTDIGAGASFVGRSAIQSRFRQDVINAQKATTPAEKPPAPTNASPILA